MALAFVISVALIASTPLPDICITGLSEISSVKVAVRITTSFCFTLLTELLDIVYANTAVGAVWSIVIVELLAVPVVEFPAASVNIAVRVATPASANPVNASNWDAVMDTVLVVFTSDIVAASPKLV